MSPRRIVLLTGWALAGCGHPAPEPVAPAPAAPPPAVSESPPASVPSASAETPAKAPTPRPLPPLASPNRLAPKADAGAADDAPATGDAPPEDARTRTLRAVASAVQDCHAQHVPTGRGSVLLRLALASDGTVSKAEIRQADAALASKAFQACVIDGARRQRFPASSEGETELEVPLQLEPVE